MSLRKNLRRLLTKQSEKSASALSGERNLGREEIVHEVRKRFKRIRAVARLGREALGKHQADEIITRFRDAGRPLSEVRDADVLGKTLDGLAGEWTDENRPEAFGTVRKRLESRRDEVARLWIDERNVFEAVRQQVAKARHLLKNLDSGNDGWDSLADGLTHSYDRCLRAFYDARDALDDDTFHEWRKRVKDWLHQSEVVASIRPDFFSRMNQQADSLSELLGDDHDLAVLRRFLEQSDISSPKGVDAILSTLNRRRSELQSSAFSQAPGAFG